MSNFATLICGLCLESIDLVIHSACVCPRSFCLVKSRGFAHLAALGLVSMMLRCMIVKTVKLVDLKESARQTASERQDLSCTYLAHHELESVFIIILVVVIIIIILQCLTLPT